MKSVTALELIHKKGLFGDHENKDNKNLIEISEEKKLLIVQIVQYKNSPILIKDINIDELFFSDKALEVICNNDTRILWTAPKSWMLISEKKDLLKEIIQKFKTTDFAITDLSHSRAIIKLEGHNSKEILKKGCPFDFNLIKKNTSLNSVFNGIAVTIDMLSENPDTVRMLVLRSFGESLYHSISDASLEFGYKGK